jgi:hypothetical protein
MTNDDRSNEDRTGDGQVPSWGDAPQQPAAGAAPASDAPRYGERVDPAQGEAPRYGSTEYAEQQGQYGRPDDAQPQYGQQQQQYGQQPYAAAAPASAGAPSWQGYEEPKRKKKTVGVVAFVLGLVALVLGVVVGYLFGTAIVNSQAFDDVLQNGGSTTPDASAFSDLQGSPELAVAGGLAILGSILGIWAIVQGIIAIVTKRGRGWGVFGLILAVLGPIALFVVYAAVAAAAVANSGVTP